MEARSAPAASSLMQSSSLREGPQVAGSDGCRGRRIIGRPFKNCLRSKLSGGWGGRTAEKTLTVCCRALMSGDDCAGMKSPPQWQQADRVLIVKLIRRKMKGRQRFGSVAFLQNLSRKQLTAVGASTSPATTLEKEIFALLHESAAHFQSQRSCRRKVDGGGYGNVIR